MGQANGRVKERDSERKDRSGLQTDGWLDIRTAQQLTTTNGAENETNQQEKASESRAERATEEREGGAERSEGNAKQLLGHVIERASIPSKAGSKANSPPAPASASVSACTCHSALWPSSDFLPFSPQHPVRQFCFRNRKTDKAVEGIREAEAGA